MFVPLFSSDSYEETDWPYVWHVENCALAVFRESWHELAALPLASAIDLFRFGIGKVQSALGLPEAPPHILDLFIQADGPSVIEAAKAFVAAYGAGELPPDAPLLRPSSERLKRCCHISQQFRAHLVNLPWS